MNTDKQSSVSDTFTDKQSPISNIAEVPMDVSAREVGGDKGQGVIDLTEDDGEPLESEGAEYDDADEFDSLMADLDDNEFCSSFANFDDDKEDDMQGDSIDIEGEEESESEEETDEGVEYVKTVAQMAKEANISDLFDPKVLGKTIRCLLACNFIHRCQL